MPLQKGEDTNTLQRLNPHFDSIPDSNLFIKIIFVEATYCDITTYAWNLAQGRRGIKQENLEQDDSGSVDNRTAAAHENRKATELPFENSMENCLPNGASSAISNGRAKEFFQ